MKMNELLRYGLPPELIELWRRRESDHLLPLQELAVKRHGLFGEGNLLIQAPTSSGKTFIGEMAVLHTALRFEKVVYVVPLKALAEEKYLDFAEKYREYGLRVIISTRDHRDFDRDFEEGRFSIAVVVYEKLAQLLVRRPERLEQIALVIADELELLSDPERGATAEILLTRVLQSQCRLVGLSAVIGEAEKLAQWMRAQLVRYERRPVELRYGVLYDGVFKYRTYNELGEGEEPMCDWGGETAGEILTHNLAELTGRGEACLVFMKARHESRQTAEILAGRLDLPAAPEAMAALDGLEPTRSRDALLRTLSRGVAFHNADLSPAERRIAEQAFRGGEARLMVSTGTLAVGMNLPAQNVFLTADRWRYDTRLGLPWKSPISRAEYENMSGRAGRYGSGQAFGRSMLIALTPFDQETLWRRYIDGEREGIEPRLAREPLEDHVLRLAASRFCRTAPELVAFLESTLTGVWVWQENHTRDEVERRIRAAIGRAVEAGVLVETAGERIEATPLGLAVASKGIDLATAGELGHWIAQSTGREWSELDLLFAAASTPGGRGPQVLLTTREYEHAQYPARLKECARGEDWTADVPINRIRNCTMQPFFEEVRAIKIALFLREWLEHAPVRALEEEYNTMAGQILGAAGQVAWVLEAAAAIATAMGAPEPFIARVRQLAECTARGLRPEALPLARPGGVPLDRSALIALTEHGLHTPEALARATPAELAQWLPNEAAAALQHWARAQLADAPPAGTAPAPKTAPEEPAPRPVLIVDDNHPDEIHIEGHRVPLQPRQYQLIRLLAAHPNTCVSYETIYQAIWGDEVVEDNQRHFQKRMLLKAIAQVAPQHAQVIQTVPRRGLRLRLEPHAVLCRASTVPRAA